MNYVFRMAMTVALGGFLMGFDASVISGVVGYIEPEFDLTKLELGWVVASLALTSTLAMLLAGPLSDRVGRRVVLEWAAVVFFVSAVASALAPNYLTLVLARMVGGFGVGAALIIAPMYIAELAPAAVRGRMVSLNQLNIVLGISVAFFTNFFIQRLAGGDQAWVASLGLDTDAWRWMLGIEALPALLFFLALRVVPESPRWLVMHGRTAQALAVMTRVSGATRAKEELAEVQTSAGATTAATPVRALLEPGLRLVLLVGLSVAVLQQITGINAVFFYAPSIFEQSGIGTDAAFMQAVLVGLVNLVFTVVAIALIDRLGRRPLLLAGVAGIALCMFVLSWEFGRASYSLTEDSLAGLPAEVPTAALAPMVGVTWHDDVAFRTEATRLLGEQAMRAHEGSIIAAAISINANLVLVAILGFVAAFAVSLGPVMWVLLSELFPNRVRGLAISVVGLVNSSVSFLVQLVFPLELQILGPSGTFLIYGLFAVVGWVIVLMLLPETKGKSLEELERDLVTA